MVVRPLPPHIPAASAAGGGFFAAPMKHTAVQEAFLDYARKTPAEQMREQILNALGLTEEEVVAMEPKQREAVEEKVKALIKQKAEQDPARKGVLVDITA